MRKAVAILLVFLLLSGIAGYAEAVWTPYDFGDFTIVYPNDIAVSVSEERVPDTIIAAFYQDCDADYAFFRSLSVDWNDEVVDLFSLDPVEFVQMELEKVVANHVESEFVLGDINLMNGEYIDSEGVTWFTFTSSFTLDVSANDSTESIPLFAVQSVYPYEASGSTYTFTIITDDLDDCELLTEIAMGVNWKA